MRHLEMSKKIVGGKYVKIELDLDNDIIKKVLISGDFFAYPIEEFENFLNTLREIKFTVKEVETVFKEYEEKIVFSGIGINDLKEMFFQLFKE
ncbi:MAG: hypothetical protein N3F64_04865 [Nitrososphaeria archaeon]|nr:hypothetical protein [Nitrososphaeria archaeon]